MNEGPTYQPPPSQPPPQPNWQPSPSWRAPQEEPGPAPGVQFAPHGERLGAYIIDALIVGLVMFIAVVIFMIAVVIPSIRFGPSPGSVSGAVAVMLVAVFLSLAYFPFFWARGGQTLGMKVFRLYVVRDRDGGRIGWGQALMRLLGYWINGFVFYLGFAWVLIDARRRGWHDLLAGTIVVKR